MPTLRSLSISLLLLCTPLLACTEPEPPPPGDGGVTEDAGPGDSGSDAGMDDAGTDPGDAGADGGADAGPVDTAVRIRRFARYRTPAGVEERPVDFTQRPVALFIEEGDSLVQLPGRAGGPGEYVFPDVPHARYHLTLSANHLMRIITDARSLDLSFTQPFRADFETLGPPDETHPYIDQAQVALDGLAPSQGYNDELILFSEEVPLSTSLLVPLEYGVVSVNQQAPVSTRPEEMPRFEQARGDRAWVAQMAARVLRRTSGGESEYYSTTVRGLRLPPFSHDGSAPMPIQGTLQAPPLKELPLDWRLSAFRALASEIHPAATVAPFGLYFSVNPGMDEAQGGWTWAGPQLLWFIGQDVSGSPDILATLGYGNPYSSLPRERASADMAFSIPFQLPNERPRRLTTGVSVADEPSGLAAGPLVPRVHPPRGLTVDGTEAYSARTLSAGAHTVAWQPPSTGNADAYMVWLTRVEPRTGTTRIATFYMDRSVTSVRLEPGLLQPGRHYMLFVTAVLAPGYDPAKGLYEPSNLMNVSTAPTVSGLLSVPAQTP